MAKLATINDEASDMIHLKLLISEILSAEVEIVKLQVSGVNLNYPLG
jgi:hypothetical protein